MLTFWRETEADVYEQIMMVGTLLVIYRFEANITRSLFQILNIYKFIGQFIQFNLNLVGHYE